MLKAALPAIVLMCAAACADNQADERIESARLANCRADVALQMSAKIAGETLSERIDRLRRMETECPPEIYGEALRVDQEAGIEWMKVVGARSEPQEN